MRRCGRRCANYLEDHLPGKTLCWQDTLLVNGSRSLSNPSLLEAAGGSMTKGELLRAVRSFELKVCHAKQIRGQEQRSQKVLLRNLDKKV